MGWIKLDRKILNNELWTDGEPFDRRSAWIDLLMLANHRDQNIIYKGKIITVKRGDVNRSLSQLSERWNWSRNKVRRFIDMLESASMVSRKSTTDGTIITIEKYALYQDKRTTNETSDETTDESSGETSVETTDESTGETSVETRGGHIQEYKEYKEHQEQKELQEQKEGQEGVRKELTKEDYRQWARTRLEELRRQRRMQ